MRGVSDKDHASRTSPYLLLDINALHADQAGDDGILDKVLVGHDLGAGEGAQCIDELGGGALEVADGHKVYTFVCLQAVASVPVAALLNEFLKLINVGAHQSVVVEEEAEADESKHDIDAGAGRNGFRKQVFVS